MEKKQKIILIAIAFTLVLLCSGLTYAYFTSATPSESGSTIVAKGGTMNIVYDNKSANISVSNIYPREEAWVTKKFQVIGNNTTDLLMFYKVKMVVDNNEFATDLSYTLTGTNTANSGILIPNITTNAYIGQHDVSLGTGYHVKGTNNIHEYTLQIFFKPMKADENEIYNNQNYAQNSNFAAHLVIEIDGTSTEKSPANWDNAGSNTLLAGIKKNYANPTKTITNLLTDSSSENEAVMSLTPDDYGLSYYFRGNVQNNFVSFAGMCWRIVRITGDGSIKLTLYDYSSANCSNTGDELAFARYDGDTYKTKFNENFDDNAYIGFMYGTPNSNTYASTHANINKSTILQNLETWYKSKLTSYTDKLADTIWCNDKSTVKDVTINRYYLETSGSYYNGEIGIISTDYNGLGYGTNDTLYGSYVRFSSLDIKGDYKTYGSGPTLICPADNDGGKLSKFTVEDTKNGNGNLDYKIGLLTLDEIIYAGGKNSYLNKNAGTYWPANPGYFEGNVVFSWLIRYDGLIGTVGMTGINALRPAIALKSNTTISGGNGTAANPFVVN